MPERENISQGFNGVTPPFQSAPKGSDNPSNLSRTGKSHQSRVERLRAQREPREFSSKNQALCLMRLRVWLKWITAQGQKMVPWAKQKAACVTNEQRGCEPKSRFTGGVISEPSKEPQRHRSKAKPPATTVWLRLEGGRVNRKHRVERKKRYHKVQIFRNAFGWKTKTELHFCEFNDETQTCCNTTDFKIATMYCKTAKIMCFAKFTSLVQQWIITRSSF